MEKKDITHCDIHPRNILYDEPTCTLTLVDFGEAKMGDLTPPPFRSPVVSVFNCPPERYGARGFNSNATTDAWAVGVIYFMAVCMPKILERC
jgi:serine/threonine protein kinase